MILGIIGAMSEELEILLKDMELETVEEKAKMKFHKGKLWGHNVVAVVCGIGKVNAAVCTQILVSEYNVSPFNVNANVASDSLPSLSVYFVFTFLNVFLASFVNFILNNTTGFA